MLILENITKSYIMWGMVLEVLKNISITINDGDFVSIMGPSGSGKSTLMNILWLLDTPTSGKYILDDQPLEHLTGDEQSRFRGEKVGFIFQWYNLIARMSALDQVMLPLSYQWISYSERKKRATEALISVWLSEKIMNKPNELSGWQQQRVAIARAVVTNPSIILADEPTGALDSKTGEEVMHILKSLHEQGKTIVLITHDHTIAAHAEKIISIKDWLIENDVKKA